MRRCPAVVLIAVVLTGACAPKIVPAPVVTTPKFPEFIKPAVPPAFAGTRAAAAEERGWAFLQSGDVDTAERDFADALKAAPIFYPAEISLGYVELARRDARSALPHFDRALEKRQDDAAALVGRGQALLALDREADALAAFESAVAADASLVDVRRRVDVLRFRGLEQGLSRARDAAKAGRLDEAMAAYTTALGRSPDSSFLYRELAGVERRRGNPDVALEHFRKAVSLDATDAASLAQIGELLEDQRDYAGAAKAYADALAAEPSAEMERRLEAVRARGDLARLPAEYRAIERTTQITRGELAALIGVRLGPLLQGNRGEAALITDIRGFWAATWITAVARAGVIEPFANHAFQPKTVVHRAELAEIVGRLLASVDARTPGQAHPWQSAQVKFSDLPTTHLAYAAASTSVAAGVMKTVGDSAFQPSGPVSGAEAFEAIARLEALAGRP